MMGAAINIDGEVARIMSRVEAEGIEKYIADERRFDFLVKLLLSPGTTISGGDSIGYPLSENK